MNMKRIVLLFGLVAVILQGNDMAAQEARARYETMKLIRKEKLDIVLPKAMRENNIDMWIIVQKYKRSDPLAADVGGGGASDKWYQGENLAYLVFTDRGGDRIERAALGAGGDSKLYDIFGATEELRGFVEERDPKNIAVNMSDYLGTADGLSHTNYLALVKALGEKYAARLISSERLVSDFRSSRVASEIAVFRNSLELTGQLVERALSNEVIKPGVTTLGDLSFWIADQLIARGHAPSYGTARIIYPEMPTDEDGRPLVRTPTRGPRDKVIKRGDLVGWDFGIRMLGGFSTDIERWAYVLREGETDVPETIQTAWDHGLKVREICYNLTQPGRTALETLNIMYDKLKELGYEICYLEDHVSDSQNIEINIGWHSVGEQGHGSGPAVWIDEEQPYSSKLMIKPTQLTSFEFFVYYPVPEWGGRKMRMDFEENMIITENGIEWLYPPTERINLIR